VILATDVTQAANDVDQLFTMTDRMTENLSAVGIEDDPDVVLADAGYCSEDNLERAGASDLDVLIATGRLKHHERVPDAPRRRSQRTPPAESAWPDGCAPRRGGPTTPVARRLNQSSGR